MQISRHWRMKSQRYRLQGVRYDDGHVSFQTRPESEIQTEPESTEAERAETEHKAAYLA